MAKPLVLEELAACMRSVLDDDNFHEQSSAPVEIGGTVADKARKHANWPD